MVPTDPQWAPYYPYGRMRRCTELYNHVTVDWDGTLYTCCFPGGDREYAVGNILTDDFRRIWNGERYRYSRRVIARRRCDEPWFETMCHDCAGVFPSESAKRYWEARP